MICTLLSGDVDSDESTQYGSHLHEFMGVAWRVPIPGSASRSVFVCCTYVLIIYGSFRLLTKSASVFFYYTRRLCSYVSVHISPRDLWLSNELGKEVDYGSPLYKWWSHKAKLDLRSTRASCPVLQRTPSLSTLLCYIMLILVFFPDFLVCTYQVQVWA